MLLYGRCVLACKHPGEAICRKCALEFITLRLVCRVADALYEVMLLWVVLDALQCCLYGDEVTRRCLSHRREDGDLAHVVVV